MTLLALTKRGLATIATAGALALPASAQFVSVNGYQAAAAPQPTQSPAVAYGQSAYVTPPGTPAYQPQSAQPAQRPMVGVAAQGAPYANAPAPGAYTYGAAHGAAPQYRVAQTLPEPSAAAAQAAEAVAAPAETLNPTPSYTAPTYAAPPAGVPMSAPATPGVHYHGAAPTMSYNPSAVPATGDCATGGCATGGCATGDCHQGVSWENYATGAPACDYAPTCAPAPVCNVAPAAPRRQWFAGVYGLFLQRADADKRLVAFCDDIGGYTGGTAYYYEPGDVAVFTDSGSDGQWGAEARFGSTFGNAGPCGGRQPFAWEVGYWGLNEDSSETIVPLIGTVGGATPTAHGLFGTIDYTGLNVDLDGAGTTWTPRDMGEYTNYKDPHETGNPDIFSTRLLGVRVRNNFQVQNLELNFWRFGFPIEAGGLGLGQGLGGGALGGGLGRGAGLGLGGGVAGGGHAACGSGCGPAACAPCRPPRRFFINGLCGVRYFRVDDDLGLAYQFTTLDGAGEPNAGWPVDYESFPRDDNSVLFHDVQADNQLVGFQLGSSMNWLVGCKWSFFADSNFGVYGNQIDVRQQIYGGGASVVTQRNGGGAAAYDTSQTSLAFLGELRAGVGYQLSCNCRLTAAYRFIGVGGLALGFDQLVSPDYSNAELVQHVNNNQSLVLHGLQTGVEWSY